MKTKFFKFDWKIIILTIIIFLIGIFSFAYTLSCSLSYLKTSICYTYSFVAFIFAFDIFLGGILNNLLRLPFNDFGMPIVFILQLIYSYLVSCIIFFIISMGKKKREV